MFSIITPTYNRYNTLYRVYDSLKQQTFKNFHWIIIDDASTDKTEDLIRTWINENNFFEITYYKLKKNKGKPFALNYGFKYCKEPITIIADSDDSFYSNTLEDLHILWREIDKTIEGNRIASVWTLTQNEEGQIEGDLFPKNLWQVNLNERILDRTKRIKGEKWHSWRTQILAEHKMFYNENAAYVSEGATWNSINKKYDFLCTNKVHRTYWFSAEGLIQQKKSKIKRAKIRYYSSYYQLYTANTLEIYSKKYYRNLAFEFIKAYLIYRDQKCSLSSSKLFISFLSFLRISMNRLFKI
ncbi:glycosyltransferase family 2 protein [Aquimarina sp. ERC-38]|uniref:glycosyltransferase family 2 protein n=1 Tax=Aquimarina sp. ERC-38 TaxID=2949996 RepID=UPI0022485BFF|nr:glycosyltransferase family 2 protein [Aquimarina sp. ERC-38]UZO80243.1 glycosyltransferase family 2 protein [Aquimarina sp. ERC-38]